MALTITLPDTLMEQLERKAEAEQTSPEAIITDLVEQLFEAEQWPTPEEVVAKIKALGPDPTAIRPAEGSLAEALRNLPPDPDFDLEEWEQQWAAVEAEMKFLNQANAIDEGHA
jgi:translation initiation factor 2B subunit (eIF-2B alpha/beta/delta family)